MSTWKILSPLSRMLRSIGGQELALCAVEIVAGDHLVESFEAEARVNHQATFEQMVTDLAVAISVEMLDLVRARLPAEDVVTGDTLHAAWMLDEAFSGLLSEATRMSGKIGDAPFLLMRHERPGAMYLVDMLVLRFELAVDELKVTEVAGELKVRVIGRRSAVPTGFLRLSSVIM